MADDSTVPNRGHSKRSRRDHKPRNVVDWNSVQSQLLAETVRLVSRSGGALRFGYTRDQGAFAIGVYGEGDPYTEYFHDAKDCADFLRELIRDYEDGSDTAGKIGL